MAGLVAFAAAIQAADTASVATSPTVSVTPINSPTVAAATNTAPLNTTSETALAERIVRSDVITAKSSPSGSRTVWAAINPFAPVKPEATTTWLSRAVWSTAVVKAASPASGDAARHESQMDVVICSQ